MPILSSVTALLGFLSRYRRTVAAVLALTVVVGTGMWVKSELDAAYVARNQALLSLDSIVAVKDTTRLRQVQAYGRLVDVYQRRAVQTEHVSDSLSDALAQETRARAELAVVVAGMDTVVEGEAPEDPTTVPSATFDFYREPFQIWAHVVMQDPPIMNMRIQQDPLPLGVYIGCGPMSLREGVTPAYVNIRTPEYATLNVTEVRYHPDVCNPGILEPPSTWELLKPAAKNVGIGLGTAAVVFEGLHFILTGEFWLPF